MQVRWYGQAAFRLVAADGKTVFIDPFQMDMAALRSRGMHFDYPPIKGERADLVLVTHEHLDHNGVEAIAGDPKAIRQSAGTFDTPVGQVVGVAADHDRVAGTQRGMNAVYVLTIDGLRVCHFGDYGQAALRPEQEAAIGAADILMLPVGGGPTVDAEGAHELVRRLRPRWVVPMHYRTPATSFLDTADAFLARFSRVEHLPEPGFDSADLPAPRGGEPVVVVPAVPT